MRSAILILTFSIGSFALADDYVTIKGQVKWNGTEAPKLVPVVTKALPPGEVVLPTEILVDAKSLGFKNVIVWLRLDTADRKDTFPTNRIKPELSKSKSKPHVLDVSHWQFEPRVIAARSGDTFEFENTSKNAHSLNITSESEHIASLLSAGPNWKLKKPLESQTTPIAFSCNVYPWMGGRMRVFDHPYFAVTDCDGKFEIKDAPVGKWRIVYWHERGFHKGKDGVLGFPIDVKADKPGGTTMELKSLPFEIPAPK